MGKLPSPAEIDLSALTDVFVRSRNPAAAWAAFHLAKTHQLPVPEAVADEINRFASEIAAPLLAAWNGDARAALSASDITAAFGIGRGKPLARDLRLHQRDTSLVADYIGFMRDKITDTMAVSALMDKYGVGEKAVRDILAEHRKTVGPTDPSLHFGSSVDDPA